MKEIDDIIKTMQKTHYDGGKHLRDATLLYKHQHNEEAAIRQVLLEWIQSNFNNKIVENESLKQRVFFLESMVAKSTFAPFVETSKKHETGPR